MFDCLIPKKRPSIAQNRATGKTCFPLSVFVRALLSDDLVQLRLDTWMWPPKGCVAPCVSFKQGLQSVLQSCITSTSMMLNVLAWGVLHARMWGVITNKHRASCRPVSIDWNKFMQYLCSAMQPLLTACDMERDMSWHDMARCEMHIHNQMA